jgi:hypothetical protein
MRRIPVWLVLLAVTGAVITLGSGAAAKGKPAAWKPVRDALLRVNDSPVKEWNVYETGKKHDPLLLQIDSRFLLLSIHDHQLFEIDPSRIEHKGDDLAWDIADRPAQPLRTSSWSDGDVGTALRIEVRIRVEDRLLVLELPHPPEVGNLPVRSQQSPAPRGRGRR